MLINCKVQDKLIVFFLRLIINMQLYGVKPLLMKKLAIAILFICGSGTGFCQCIDQLKIGFGGHWEQADYQSKCPVYNFSYNGDTSKRWSSTINIDINQLGKEFWQVKASLERKIKNYAGGKFFSRLSFCSVNVVYPERMSQFKKEGNTWATMKYCRSKYYFFYHFVFDNNICYNIGFAVNKNGDVLSKFNFPSKDQYAAIDEKFNICKAIETARKINKKIDPISKVMVDYDEKSHRFYWLLSQEILNLKEGENDVNQVYIEASDPKIAKAQIGKANIVF